MTVKIVNKSKYPDPQYATPGSAGIDLYADIKEPLILKTGVIEKVPTGIFLEMPDNIEGQIRPRSSMGAKGIIIPNAPGTIDSDYRGEIRVLLTSINGDKIIMPGQKIAQIVFGIVVKPEMVSLQEASQLSDTERGDGGFGSTGDFKGHTNIGIVDFVTRWFNKAADIPGRLDAIDQNFNKKQ